MRKSTDLENRVHWMLVLLGIPHTEQVKIGPYTADFLVNDQALVIEADGGPWHNTPEAKERDAKRDHYLKSLGFSVLRISEKDCKDDPIGCMHEIQAYRRHLPRGSNLGWSKAAPKPPKSYSKLLKPPAPRRPRP